MCGLFVFAALGVSRHSGGRRHRSKKIFDRRSCVHVSASPITIISHLPTYLPTSIMIRALYVPLALGALLAFAAPARTSELQFKGDSRIFYQLNPPVSAAPTPSLPQNGPLYEFTRIGGTEAASTNERTNERGRPTRPTHTRSPARARALRKLSNPGLVKAAPHEYMDSWGPYVKDLMHQQLYQDTYSLGAVSIKGGNRVLHQQQEYPPSCGRQNPATQAGNMWFTAMGCRIASFPLSYVNKAGEFKTAAAGEMIDPISAPGESVHFPAPPRPDCFANGNVCSEDEFCMAQRHEKWGPWAVAPGGYLAEKKCAQLNYGWNTTLVSEDNLAALNQSVVNDVCGGVYCGENGLCGNFSGQVNQVASISGGEPPPWRPIQGQCVKYRQKGQSCYLMLNDNPFYQDAFKATADPEFNDGGGIDRPYVCAPGLECTDIGNGVLTCTNQSSLGNIDDVEKWGTCSDELGLTCRDGLVCTGSNVPVLNNTCVEPRPQDVCFAGPWWISTYCPRSNNDTLGQPPPCGGMTKDFAFQSLYTAMLLSPGEYVSSGSCSYWFEQPVYIPANDTSGWPGRTSQLRNDIYAIFDTLWPRHLAGFEDGPPPFEEIERDVYVIPTTTNDQCLAASKAEGCGAGSPNEASISPECRLQRKLAYAGRIINEPNKVWSLIHWVMTNLRDDQDMTPEQVQASKAIALILRDNFWCNDCRGFFDGGVLSQFGYPPSSSKAIDHEKYWHAGHNEASEHVATTRGSHPWIYQLANQTSGPNTGSKYQNPFYLPFDEAHAQWKQVERDEDGSCPTVSAVQSPSSPRASSATSRQVPCSGFLALLALLALLN